MQESRERKSITPLLKTAAGRSCWTYSFCAFLLVYVFFTGIAQAAEKTIGVIMTGDIQYYKDIHKAFLDGLNEEGLIAQGKVDIIVQTPTPEVMAWTNAARKLAGIGSAVIVAYGAPATQIVLNETEGIPVVFAGVYDPQAMGVTGKDSAGVSSKVPVTTVIKGLKTISNFTKLGVIINDSEKDTLLQAEEIKQLESKFGFQSTKFNVKRPGDSSKISGVDALFLTTSCSAMHCVDNITGFARKAKIPTATMIGGGEGKGVILTLSADPHEQGKEAAKLLSKILKGEKPSSFPVVLPKKVEMIVNLKEATEIGLKVPFDLLSAATKVIK